MIWSVFEKVCQSNARINDSDTLVVTVYLVKMPVNFGKRAIKSMVIPLSTMAHFKKSIMEMKAGENCLADVLVIAISRVGKDPNYNSYRRGH